MGLAVSEKKVLALEAKMMEETDKIQHLLAKLGSGAQKEAIKKGNQTVEVERWLRIENYHGRKFFAGAGNKSSFIWYTDVVSCSTKPSNMKHCLQLKVKHKQNQCQTYQAIAFTMSFYCIFIIML